MNQWIKFFLSGVIETAKSGKITLQSIVELRKKYESKIMTMGRRSEQGEKLLLFLFSNPIVSVAQISNHLKLEYDPSNRLIRTFHEFEFLKKSQDFQEIDYLFYMNI